MLQHVLSYEKENMIISLHQSVMIYIGFQYVNELNLNCAVSSINASIRVLHHISLPCVSNVNIDEMDGRRHLRSAVYGDLVKPMTRGRTYGQRSFAMAGPSLWNSLSSSLKDYSLAINELKQSLKPNFLGERMHYNLTFSVS